MGKPSIFSKEYEKKMKKRRRNVLVVFLIIILIISVLVVKFSRNSIDYPTVKKNIQAWIDSDNNIEQKNQVLNKETINQQENQSDKSDKKDLQEEENINLTLANGSTTNAICIKDSKGEKVFKNLDTSDKEVTFDISPSGKQMIVVDTNSIINLYNVDGSSKTVSKDEYISTSGSVFKKENAIQSNPKYLWNANPKFISDDKVIFVTNRPYFNKANLKQYLWITDFVNNNDKILWDLVGSDIEIGSKEEKGIKVTVDGKIYYIDSNGNYIQ